MKKQSHKLAFKAALSLFLTIQSIAAFAFTPIKGAILKEYKGAKKLMARPATDLLDKEKGRAYLPFELQQKFEDSEGLLDISVIDPEPSDIWSPQVMDMPLKVHNDMIESSIPVASNQLETLHYVESFINEDSFHRFTIEKYDETGLPFNYNIFVGRSVHNVLLRRNLLRKLGYKVPATKHIEKAFINFEDEDAKKSFLKAFKENTPLTDEYRYIKMEKKTQIILQDFIITESIEPIYNFSLGYMDASIIKGRRIMNALLLPFNLVDAPESLNMFSWSPGRIISENIYLPHVNSSMFSTTWHDAQWMTRRILNLKKKDWVEIVEESALPPTIQVILLEKLLSRRDSLSNLFDIDAIELQKTAAEDINNGNCLIEGKVICKDWEGHGEHFAHGDPESPLSNSEMMSFLKSKGLGVLIDSAMAAFNNKIPFLSTDMAGKNKAAIDKILADSLAESLTSGNPQVVPLTTWAFPIFQGKGILSRNIIAGAFMGTDNQIQIVDSIGFSVGAGMFMGVVGLPSYMPSAGVSALANYSRTYSHIKPITSTQKALKEKFKNVAVPLLKKKFGKFFKEIIQDDFNQRPEKEQIKVINKALGLFKESMEVGESILITDTIGAGVTAQASASIKFLTLSLGVSPDIIVVSRLHIRRSSEDTIQIYKDFGNLSSVGINLGIAAGVPIVNTSVKFSKGNAKTKFMKVDINPRNPKVIENLSALKSALVSGSLKKLKRMQKPWVIKHKIGQNDSRLGIFTLRMNKIKNKNYLTLKAPSGEEKTFFRRYVGKTVGNDYQAYTAELISYFTGKLLNNTVDLSGLGGGNPGNSFYGTAKNTIATFEGEVNKAGAITKPFVKIKKMYNGWRIKRKKAIRLLKKMKKHYGMTVFNPKVLNNTEKLFLYNISVDFNFYKEGITHMLGMKKADVKKLFKKHNGTFDAGAEESKKIFIGSGVKRFLRQQKKALKFWKTKKHHKYSDHLVKMLTIVQKKLSATGITKMMGGIANFYVSGQIEGFRDGSEDADSEMRGHYQFLNNPYISNSIGEFGEGGVASLRGPIAPFIQRSGMTSSEFYLSWLLGRVY
jgi:hypothetical protein